MVSTEHSSAFLDARVLTPSVRDSHTSFRGWLSRGRLPAQSRPTSWHRIDVAQAVRKVCHHDQNRAVFDLIESHRNNPHNNNSSLRRKQE